MFDGKFRQSADATMAPVGRVLGRAGLSADVLTASGLVFALATAGCIAAGLFWQAIVLLLRRRRRSVAPARGPVLAHPP